MYIDLTPRADQPRPAQRQATPAARRPGPLDYPDVRALAAGVLRGDVPVEMLADRLADHDYADDEWRVRGIDRVGPFLCWLASASDRSQHDVADLCRQVPYRLADNAMQIFSNVFADSSAADVRARAAGRYSAWLDRASLSVNPVPLIHGLPCTAEIVDALSV